MTNLRYSGAVLLSAPLLKRHLCYAMAAQSKPKTKEQLEQLKGLAYELFMNTDKTQKEIADRVGVSEKTMCKWVEEGKWAELKALEKVSKGATIRNIHKRIFELSESDDPAAADRASKWGVVLEKLDQKKVSVPNIINVCRELEMWLYPQNPELAKALNKYSDLFIKERANG